MLLEVAAGALCLLVGVWSAVGSVRELGTPASAGDRILLVVHEWAKAGFWLSLGALILGYALAEEPQGLRWFVMVPIVMAALRLLASVALSRR